MYTVRKFLYLGFAIATCILSAGYYMQYQLGMEPCSLCLLQRAIYFIIGAIFILSALHNPKTWGLYVYSLANVCANSIGIFLASRQLWLLSLPPMQLPECTPGIERLMKFYPFIDAIIMVLKNSGECGKEKTKILGLYLAHWSLAGFVVLTMVCIVAAYLHAKKRWN